MTNLSCMCKVEPVIPLPLDLFFWRLSEEGIKITIADWERLHHVFSCNGQWTLRRLCNVLSALLAKDKEQLSLFERCFYSFFDPDYRSPDWEGIEKFRALLEDPANHYSRYKYSHPVHNKESISPEEIVSSKDTISNQAGSQPIVSMDTGQQAIMETGGIPEKSIVDQTLPNRLIFYDVWLTLGCIHLNIIDFPNMKWKDEESLAWDPSLPHIFPWNNIGSPLPPRIDSDSLNYLADCIGYYQAESPSNNLDIFASIQAGIRASGIPRFIFQPVRMQRTLVILEDICAKARQWNPIAQEFTEEIQHHGVNVLHGKFSSSPLRFYTSSGEHLYIEDIEEKRSGAIVLIFSDSQCLRSPDFPLILEDLSQWPNLAWLDLREPRSWDKATFAITRFGIDVHPASQQGIICAMSKFLTETGSLPDWFVETCFNKEMYNPDMPLDAYLSRVLGCALPWAQACSILQPLSYRLAEHLRSNFFPDIPQGAIERLHNLPGTTVTVEGIHFDNEVCFALRKGFKETMNFEPVLSTRIGKFIIQEMQKVIEQIPGGISSRTSLAGILGEVSLLQLKRDLRLKSGKNFICQMNCELCPPRLKAICPQKRLNEMEAQFPQLDNVIRKAKKGLFTKEKSKKYPPPDMVFIPEGVFRMGDAYIEGHQNERPVHDVRIGAFYLDVYPVTGRLWREVYNWAVKKGYTFENEGKSSGQNHPVTDISWHDAVKWANARSEMMERTPVYYTDGTCNMVYRRGQIDLTQEAVRWEADGFRLPTEAEWEKASRGGLEGHHFPWESLGSGYNRFINRETANHSNNEEGTTEVGKYSPNGYGLYDMAGNVWEWCWDWYDGEWYSKSESSIPDSRGPVVTGKNRVCRGGSWLGDIIHLRCSFRNCHISMTAKIDIGLRLAIGQAREWESEHAMQLNSSASKRSHDKKAQQKIGIIDIRTDPQISVRLTLKHVDGAQQELVTAQDLLMVKPGKWRMSVEANGYELKKDAFQIAPETKKQIIIQCVTGKHPQMAMIPEGAFKMGDPYAEGENNERPVHEVWVGAFYLDVYPVTGTLWQEVYEWAVKHGYTFEHEGRSRASDHPVTGISWYDAVKWANARSEMSGRKSVYYTDETHSRVYRQGQIDLTQGTALWEADGFRLPTEAEWEKASRGGDEGHHYGYKRFIDREKANSSNHEQGTTEIGRYAPNGYGLYDMAGNVWEWCWDWYDGKWYNKLESIVPDCKGPVVGSHRVSRGDSWFVNPDDIRCSKRNFYRPGITDRGLGFRLALVPVKVRGNNKKHAKG